MCQKYTSANTSINSSRVPALYKKIDFKGMKAESILDFGCGKYNTGAKFAEDQNLFWAGYDPYNRSESENFAAICNAYDALLCSSVLNVIDTEKEIERVADFIQNSAICEFYFVSVYEGDRSGVGHKTKEDCYQRNEKVQAYLRFFPGAVIKHGVITNAPEFVK